MKYATPIYFAFAFMVLCSVAPLLYAERCEKTLEHGILDAEAEENHAIAVKKLGRQLSHISPERADQPNEKQGASSYRYILLDKNFAKSKTVTKKQKTLKEIKADLTYLKHVNNLTDVWIEGEVLTDDTFGELAKCTKLKGVTLQGKHFTNRGIKSLHVSPSLREVQIEYPESRGEFLKRAYKDHQLPDNDIVFEPSKYLSSEGVLAILKTRQLTGLWLHGVKADSKLVAAISQQKKMTTLIMPGKFLTVEDLESLSRNEALSIIELQNHVSLELEEMQKLFHRFSVVEKSRFEGGYTILLEPLDVLTKKQRRTEKPEKNHRGKTNHVRRPQSTD